MPDVRAPKMGMSTVDVDLTKWLVQVGDQVRVDSMLAEVESEKATIEIEAEVAGRVSKILGPAGQTIEVGTVICRIAEEA